MPSGGTLGARRRESEARRQSGDDAVPDEGIWIHLKRLTTVSVQYISTRVLPLEMHLGAISALSTVTKRVYQAYPD